MSAFDDRVVSLDAPEQLAALGAVLGSRTRVAVLAALVRSDKPLHINELARRVGVDASPVRTHLELLLKEGLVREIEAGTGRERRFETPLTAIALTLQGVNRPVAAKGSQVPKAAAKVQKKLDALAKDMARIEEKARRYREQLTKATSAARAPG